MFEHLPSDQLDFEHWLARELRRPAPMDPARAARIMARVRAAPAPARRRQWAPPLLGLAVAASLAGLVALRPVALAAGPRGAAATAAALRDTMAASLRDTMLGVVQHAVRDAVRDTLWLVEFALVAPAATHVAVSGDFNGWNPRATPLTRRAGDGSWTATVALTPGRHRYAFVVDDSQWVAAATTPGERGRPWLVRTPVRTLVRTVSDSAN